MEKLKTDKKSLKKFGVTMFVVLSVISGIIFFRYSVFNNWLIGIGLLFLVLGIASANLLKPVYIVWMRFAFILSWINTRVLLIAMFYLVFTPIGLAMKLFGKDMLELKLEKDKQSYWKQRQNKEFKQADYQHQF